MRHRVLALLGGLLLLLPAAALAQSAGDKQYTDPFSGSPPAKRSPAAPPRSSAPSGSVPQSHPLSSPGQLASSGSQGSGSSSSSSGQTSSGSLPRTGQRTWVLVLMGVLMVVGGVLLRLGLRPLPQRAAGEAPVTLGRDVRLRHRPRRRRRLRR